MSFLYRFDYIYKYIYITTNFLFILKDQSKPIFSRENVTYPVHIEVNFGTFRSRCQYILKRSSVSFEETEKQHGKKLQYVHEKCRNKDKNSLRGVIL